MLNLKVGELPGNAENNGYAKYSDIIYFNTIVHVCPYVHRG